jgi:assimilatory nitrate reductase catalytic subunit
MTAVCTTCPYCGVGCGVIAQKTGARDAIIAGDSAHPANRGKLCSKGTHLGETIGLEGRLLSPQISGKRASWDTALDLVAQKFSAAIDAHGPESVAFYVSGQLLTEDYYVANKLMKGFIGAGNIDTNSRLCMASAVAAHIRSFGEDVVPANYDDVEAADLIVLTGSNTAWCHPILYQRMMAAKEARGARIIVIDPRRTETAETADLHLPIAPGSDVALFNALLAYLWQQGFLEEHVLAPLDIPQDFWSRLRELGDPVAYAARACEVDASLVSAFFDAFAHTPKTVTLFSQGVNQSSRGTDKANAIINVHLATGRIGKPGAAPFSITGQPNAMGGREVGGLATQLAAHMDFSAANVDRLQRFWTSGNVAHCAGLKAVDLFRAVKNGKIKALWIMATNPAVSMPDANEVRAALATCPFVVVSDCMTHTDTTQFAHVLLPSAAWGEKDGTVTNSERMISRQRPFLEPPGEARPDWWQMAQVGQRMGRQRNWNDAFGFASPADIFREHAALSAFENTDASVKRLFNIGNYARLSDTEYDALTPFQWGGAHPFADGYFSTASGRAQLVAVSFQPAAHARSASFPFALNTGRLRDHWHTMTRTGLSPNLSRHRSEPTIEISSKDAQTLAVQNGDLAAVSTALGRDIFRVLVNEGQRPGELFVPIHWNGAVSSAGKTGVLVNADTDPVSGQPEFKHTPAAIQKYQPKYFGLFVGRDLPERSDLAYWTRMPIRDGMAMEFASDEDCADIIARMMPSGKNVYTLDMQDKARGDYRMIATRNDICVALLFLSPQPIPLSRAWLFDQFVQNVQVPLSLLAGRAAAAHENPGETVCTCFNIGLKTIVRAIETEALTTVDQIGKALRAGTNCGSCRPALARILREGQLAHAA